MPRETLSILSLESQEYTAKQDHVSPAGRLVVSALHHRLDPRFTFDAPIPPMRHAGLFSGIVLQDRDGRGIKDAQEFATRV